ncbi:MAG: polymer-forming cytoskeletal protein [Acidobacteriota bacterium]|nr:polymer-forming cytoskeletal protein [Acidobacteriota bacterium]
MSSAPFKSPEADVSRNSATIGKAVKIIGQIFSKEDLYVDGDVEGTIECQDNKLTIGPNGKMQAGVRAREVVVLGQIKGNVEANDRIDIRKDARLVGDIKTARIVIEDGAYFKGSIDIVKPDAAKTAAAGANPGVNQATAGQGAAGQGVPMPKAAPTQMGQSATPVGAGSGDLKR